jgi:hypothetical protein
MQRYSFLCALIFFLESEKLALHSDVGKLLEGNNLHCLSFTNLMHLFLSFSIHKRGRWFPFGC